MPSDLQPGSGYPSKIQEAVQAEGNTRPRASIPWELFYTHYHTSFITIYYYKLHNIAYYMVKRDSLSHWNSTAMFCNMGCSSAEGTLCRQLQPRAPLQASGRFVSFVRRCQTWGTVVRHPPKGICRDCEVQKQMSLLYANKDASGTLWFQAGKYEMLETTSLTY